MLDWEVLGAVVGGAGAVLLARAYWRMRTRVFGPPAQRLEVPERYSGPELNQVVILDEQDKVTKYEVPGPVSRFTTIVCTAHIEQPEHWINAPGWLAPDGQFFPALARGHTYKAFEIIEPDHAARGLQFDDPARNWERELEERGYAKYLSNPYWSGWTHTRRLTRTQRDAIADWFLFHQKKFPEWLQALY